VSPASRKIRLIMDLRRSGVGDTRVLGAMELMPREIFAPDAFRDKAYENATLPIGRHQTMSAPIVVGLMTQALGVGDRMKVLEIGTGSGYQAAIIAQIAYRVYTVERIHSLLIRARKLFDRLHLYNILTRYADGTSGWSGESPFDAIIVTAGAPRIPAPLVNQLTIGGRLVIPVGDRYSQELIKVYRDDHGIRQSNLGGCRFVKLVGEHGWENSSTT
jgi:protein-L-isoaspartate(D-aspartate) O-methyltransferase